MFAGEFSRRSISASLLFGCFAFMMTGLGVPDTTLAADKVIDGGTYTRMSDGDTGDQARYTSDGNLTINGATFNTQNPVTSYTEAEGIETSRDNSLKLTDPSTGGFISDEAAQQKGPDYVTALAAARKSDAASRIVGLDIAAGKDLTINSGTFSLSGANEKHFSGENITINGGTFNMSEAYTTFTSAGGITINNGEFNLVGTKEWAQYDVTRDRWVLGTRLTFNTGDGDIVLGRAGAADGPVFNIKDSLFMAVPAGAGSMVLNSGAINVEGTFRSSLLHAGTDLTMNGGSLSVTSTQELFDDPVEVQSMLTVPNLTINDGTVVVHNADINGENSITLNGGTYTLSGTSVINSNGTYGEKPSVDGKGRLDINGGTFVMSGSTLFRGNTALNITDGTFAYEGTPNGSHGTVNGNTFNIPYGFTMESAGNLSVSGGDFLLTGLDRKRFSGQDITISGGNFQLSNGYTELYADNKLEITGGNISLTGQEGYSVYDEVRGKELLGTRLTLSAGEGGVVFGNANGGPTLTAVDALVMMAQDKDPTTITFNNGTYSIIGVTRLASLDTNASDLIINGGTFYTDHAGNGSSATTVINGGTFETVNGGYWGTRGGGDFNINGGTFSFDGTSGISASTGGGSLNIKGGTFDFMPGSYLQAAKPDVKFDMNLAGGTFNMALDPETGKALHMDAGTGSLTLDRNLALHVSNAATLAAGTYTVADFAAATNGVNLTENGVAASGENWTNDLFATTHVRGDGNSASLVVDVKNKTDVIASLPGNRNVRANAAAFDRILSNADGQTAAYLNGLSGMTPEGAAETLRQVSGENTLNSGYANINQLNLFREGIRNGVKGLAPTDEPRSQMWITALGGISNQGSNDSISGFDSYTGGLAAGYALTMSKALVGVGLAYIDTDVYSRDDLNHTDMRSWVGSLYAALDLDPVRLEADVMYGQGYNESETSFSGLPDAEGDYNSYFWGFGARASYNFLFNEGATRLTPYVGIEYASVTQDAYTESGPLGRHFDVDRLERWTLPVGIELQHDFVIDDEKSISTCIGVGYARDLNDSQAEASVYLGPNSAPLRVHGVEMGKDALRYNAGVSFNVNDTVSIFGQYNGETRSNYTDNSFRLGVEIRF